MQSKIRIIEIKYLYLFYIFLFVYYYYYYYYYYYCYYCYCCCCSIPLPVYLPAEMIALRDDQITIEHCKIVLRAPTRLGAKVAIKCNIFWSSSVVDTKQATIHEFLSSC